MISKRSFHKMMGFDLRRRSWLMMLLFATDLLLLPVQYLIRLQNAAYLAGDTIVNGVRVDVQQAALEQKLAVTQSMFSMQNTVISVTLIAFALIAAMSGYEWLCSRQKVDFYHSIAVRRSRMFWIPYIDGAVIVLLPYLICSLIGFAGIGSVHGQITGETVSLMMHALLGNALLFLSSYAIGVLAMVLAGRVLIGGLLSVMLLVYGPLAAFLYQLLMASWFETWMDTGQPGAGYYASPAGLLFMQSETGRLGALAIVLLLVYLAVATVAAWIIYRHRPSEAAGNAYVHPILQAVFKVAVAIPSAFVVGLIFREMAYSRPRFWFVAGALIGVLTASAVMEAVQSVDLRSILRGWRSALIAVGGTGVILLLLLFDPLGYDTWLPRQDELSAIGCISTDWSLADQIAYQDYYSSGETRTLLKETMTSDVAAVYPLAEAGVESLGASQEGSGTWAGVQMVYQLKSGAKRYRQYIVPLEALQSVSDALTENRAYREQMYPINRTTADMFNRVSVSDWIAAPPFDDWIGEGEIALSESERRAFLEALQLDINGCGLARLRDAVPVGIITLYRQAEDGGEYALSDVPSSYYIYPMYEQTISFLEGKGYTFRKNQSLQQAAAGASTVEVYYNGSDYRLQDAQDIGILLDNIVKTKHWETVHFVTITMDYPDGTGYNVDCAVKDDAALEALLKGKEVQLYEETVG